MTATNHNCSRYVIAFIDLEADPRSGKILDIGAQCSDGTTLHGSSVLALLDFVRDCAFLCGHNIVRHDLALIGKAAGNPDWGRERAIDTLLLSPLLFPTRPYHRLIKDEKLLPEEHNDPLEDARKAQDLLQSERAAFAALASSVQQIYASLLGDQPGFAGFFRYINWHAPVSRDTASNIKAAFAGRICAQASLEPWIGREPIALAYALALISASDRYSITPPWVVHSYPKVEAIMRALRNEPCAGCAYCNEALDPVKALQRFFGYPQYRTYEGKPLQEDAVRCAIRHQSLLAVFPTGGGKSITFQVPALLSGENARALTVVISPLQSLMKDQVDNLEAKDITDAVTINGLLDPIERHIAIERVQGTSKEHSVAHLLYLSPESLRSVTIEKLLLGRKIARFVIDEAHCFSAWGQDFRVDYLYIGEFIQMLQAKKGLTEPIPVSCFTATAKPQVIDDIRNYFKEKLGLELDLFQAGTSRANLHYSVLPRDSDDAKYGEVRRLLEAKSCPSIVYVSRTRRAATIASRLKDDGFRALAYHGKMDKDERVANQNAFLRGEVDVMVATSAFGMGVDKEDVGQVIHYDISDSLENYVQEAGRAGRSENISADCFVLFDEADLDKHFVLLNQTKLDVKEINQVWKAIRDLTRRRDETTSSALEIARKAGWDDTVAEIETRVKTAIAALEDAGFVRRGQNMPRVFATSILPPNAQAAITQIEELKTLTEADKVKAIRIIKKLFASKSRRLAAEEDAESRVDYISDHLGIVREEVIRIVNVLVAEKILADTKDLTAFIRRNARVNRSLAVVEQLRALELFLATRLEEGTQVVNLKEWCEEAETSGLTDVTPVRIRTLLNFWAVKNWIRKRPRLLSHHHMDIELLARKEEWLAQMDRRHSFARLATEYLFDKMQRLKDVKETDDEVLVEFSLVELKEALAGAAGLFGAAPELPEVEDTLFFLSRIEAVKLEGGFLVIYNRLKLERLQQNNLVKYTKEHYSKLAQHYKNKGQQIHIVGAFAKRMIQDYDDALRFADDYFRMDYVAFLKKYFSSKEQQDDLGRTMTKARFEKIFIGTLSPTQQQIILDQKHARIVVAAGPGSGKTRVLVHKMASILLTEDVKHEQLLMLTFSRSAATEFKLRLLELIGNAAHRVEIKTFHSYAFDLLGRSGNLEGADKVLERALDRIKAGEVEPSRITKAVLLVDEAQDMNEEEYAFVQLLVERNEDLRVLLVGDEDQNIYEFRGASARYLKEFWKVGAHKYELNQNYRSTPEVVAFSNAWAETLPDRLKDYPMISEVNRAGSVQIIEYASQQLALPVLAEVERNMLHGGSLAVLTFTNEEAGQVAALLAHRGIAARLVQQQDKKLQLRHLRELRLFSERVLSPSDGPIIDESEWLKAREGLRTAFAESDKLDHCLRVIDRFGSVNNLRKYKSDWINFLQESKWEDFAFDGQAQITISTMHKSKGREFDRVIVLLSRFQGQDPACRRLLYVAATRARQQLIIHTDTAFSNRFVLDGLTYGSDEHDYPEPDRMRIQVDYDEVNLGYFEYVQHRVARLSPGARLQLLDDGLGNEQGQRVLQFAKKFKARLDVLAQRGYHPAAAWVEFIVWWKDKKTAEEHQIVLAGMELGREYE